MANKLPQQKSTETSKYSNPFVDTAARAPTTVPGFIGRRQIRRTMEEIRTFYIDEFYVAWTLQNGRDRCYDRSCMVSDTLETASTTLLDFIDEDYLVPMLKMIGDTITDYLTQEGLVESGDLTEGVSMTAAVTIDAKRRRISVMDLTLEREAEGSTERFGDIHFI